MALLNRATLSAAVAVALAACLAGCGGADPFCEVIKFQEKRTDTYTIEGVVHRLRLGNVVSGRDATEDFMEFNVVVDNTTNVTTVSVEVYPNLAGTLQVGVTTLLSGEELGVYFDPPDPCNSGLTGTITVPVPLEAVLFQGSGSATVDKLAPNLAEPSGFEGKLTAEAGSVQGGGNLRGYGSLSIGEFECTGLAVPCDRPQLKGVYGGTLNISQLNVRRVSMQTSDGAINVEAGEIAEWAWIFMETPGDTFNLNNLASAFTRVYSETNFGSLTGGISDELVLFPLADGTVGTINTTVGSELCVDCRNFEWDESQITLLGDFKRTGSCFGGGPASCPQTPSLSQVALV